MLNTPTGIAFDSAGDVFVADAVNGDVYKFAAGTYAQSVFASGLTNAFGVAIDASGDVYVSLDNAAGTINEYSPTGQYLNTVGGLSYPTFITLSAGTAPYPAWTGGNSTTNWADSANWSTGVVPGSTSSTIDTDTALFNQNAGGFSPLSIDLNRNVMNITFDNSSGLLSSTLTIGAAGGNALLLTDGGTIQITASVAIRKTSTPR